MPDEVPVLLVFLKTKTIFYLSKVDEMINLSGGVAKSLVLQHAQFAQVHTWYIAVVLLLSLSFFPLLCMKLEEEAEEKEKERRKNSVGAALWGLCSACCESLKWKGKSKISGKGKEKETADQIRGSGNDGNRRASDDMDAGEEIEDEGSGEDCSLLG